LPKYKLTEDPFCAFCLPGGCTPLPSSVTPLVATLAARLHSTCWNDWEWKRQVKCKWKKLRYEKPAIKLAKTTLGTVYLIIGCHFIACWTHFKAHKSHGKNVNFNFDSNVTRACKTMTQSDSTVLVIRLWLDWTKSWFDSDWTRKTSDDFDSTLTRRACDSDQMRSQGGGWRGSSPPP